MNSLKNTSKWFCGASVDIISVIDWTFLPDEVNIEAPGFYDFCSNSAVNILDLAKEEAEKNGFKVGNTIKRCGVAVQSILEQLDAGCYDLVLLGSHGKKGLRSWLGSVSHEITTNAKTCVYISKKENEGQKILFTVDGTKLTTQGTLEAFSLLNLEGKEIYLCMVNEEPDLLFMEGMTDTNWLLEISQHQKDFASRAIDEARKLINAGGCNIKEAEILTGNPAAEIIRYTKENNIDLVLMSSRYRREKKKFLNSSVCKRVLENTSADVLIAKTAG